MTIISFFVVDKYFVNKIILTLPFSLKNAMLIASIVNNTGSK